MVVTFVRLKLRLTANGLRGKPARISLFVLGVLGPVEKALERRHKLRKNHDQNGPDDVYRLPP